MNFFRALAAMQLVIMTLIMAPMAAEGGPLSALAAYGLCQTGYMLHEVFCAFVC